jgi:integrase
MLASYAVSTVQQCVGVLRAAAKLATSMAYLPSNPVTFQFSEFTVERPAPRQGRLTTFELLTLVNEIFPVHTMSQALSAWLLLHGTRIGETAQMTWQQVNEAEAVWIVPLSVQKARKHKSGPFFVPLTSLSLKVLAFCRKFQATHGLSSRCVFLTERGGALTVSAAQGMVARFAGEWSAHDVRKLFKALLQQLRVDHVVSEHALNHTLDTMQKTYNQESLFGLHREALESLSAHVRKLGGGRV